MHSSATESTTKQPASPTRTIAHRLLWFQCITPLHNGSGEGLGTIDRPIIREVHTGYPFIQSSSIKGAVSATQRHENEQDNNEAFNAAFGQPGTEGNQGFIGFTDALLLLFPVRSLFGTTAWVTCKRALARLYRYCEIARTDSQLKDALQEVLRDTRLGDTATVTQKVGVLCEANSGRIYLEQFVLPCQQDSEEHWSTLVDCMLPMIESDDALRTYMKDRMVLLRDDDYEQLTRRATAVEANIKIEPSGVTKDGSLRYTEYLPAESVLFSFLTIEKATLHQKQVEVDELEKTLKECLGLKDGFGVVQFGADESKGKGIVRLRYSNLDREAQ